VAGTETAAGREGEVTGRAGQAPCRGRECGV
jgi:hypothetical protein